MESSKNSLSKSKLNEEGSSKWNSSSQEGKSKESSLSDKNRIGFLNQCKMELSAEVYHWKEENFKLRKENEAAMKRIEELESALNKISSQSKQLETTLSHFQEDNKRLRMRTSLIGEANSILHDRLSKSKFHSYPWTDLTNHNHDHSCLEVSCLDNTPSSNTESLEEVSRKLFKQMQQEILEMEKFSHGLGIQELSVPSTLTPNYQNEVKVKSLSGSDTEDDESPELLNAAATKIRYLLDDSHSLKHHLRFQKEKLQFLQNQITKGNKNTSHLASCDENFIFSNSVKSKENNLVTSNPPTDETFRAYFTKQLNSTKMNDDKKSINQDALHSALKKKNPPLNINQQMKYQTHVQVPFNVENTKQTNVPSDNERICPICKTVFPKQVTQKEFEVHVIEHLETVGSSLLEQG